MNSTASKIIEHEPTAIVPTTPMEMLRFAIERGSGIEILEKLLSMSERWEATQARKAFDQAMAAAKAEIPVIFKNKEVSFGSGKAAYRHEDLAEIAKTVEPLLAKHGLSYRFRTASTDKTIAVTCIVFGHGHSEENSLSSAHDSSGSKNPIQAMGSAMTYLQRYALKAALGLSASADDDGRVAADDAKISEEQLKELIGLADEMKADKIKFCQYLKVESLADLTVKNFPAAKHALEMKRKA